jgi:hypothetical protein
MGLYIHSINGFLLVLVTGITRAITVTICWTYFYIFFLNGNPLFWITVSIGNTIIFWGLSKSKMMISICFNILSMYVDTHHSILSVVIHCLFDSLRWWNSNVHHVFGSSVVPLRGVVPPGAGEEFPLRAVGPIRARGATGTDVEHVEFLCIYSDYLYSICI